ncbi:PP2C family protein-serine/threonine phosphatase [Fuchsiella alkaliacetigena]|uniref:PP2C family protein-serine/threonine phosphatase n=1 Tax=Fuchsiella alkaliacetigena TaxID=957042 RepID=UPI00200A1767|nr:SpoIIE family protein phosphatase [Fuchsiella alkaliacetigena]MCK8825870.1 SpoIIE family protein phosphatase [Fuchsiella alkaliacetigena]
MNQRRYDILVVDDMVNNLDIIKEILLPEYKVKIAVNGKIALKIAQKQHPDLILLDIVMPEMDGYELCKKLKDNPITKDIPVIFLTGLSKTQEETKGLNLGAVDYIAKPIKPAILKARVETHLELSNAKKKLRSQKQEIEELYQKLNNEINKAAQIHERNFLAKIPDVEGVSFAVHFQPTQRLGGDFYNFIKAEDKLIIYLSDVTGHGMEGIVFNAFVKEAVSSYISIKRELINPERILEHIYEQYCLDNYPDDYFVCIFLAVLDLGTNELSYSGVGFQNPPLLSHDDGERLLLESAGAPISSVIPIELMNFKAKQVSLSSGSTVLFSTDGIVEQMNGELNYEERFKELFYAHSGQTPAEIVELINEDFKKFNDGSSQGDDDITYIVLQID